MWRIGKRDPLFWRSKVEKRRLRKIGGYGRPRRNVNSNDAP